MQFSKYARKKMLENVAANFRDEQLNWLNTQDEFTKTCATETNPGKIIALGKKLLAERKVEPVKVQSRFANVIEVPEAAPAPGTVVEEGVAVGVGES